MEYVCIRWQKSLYMEGDGSECVSPVTVISLMLCLKDIFGMEKSAMRGPRVRSHSIPRTTSAPAMGMRWNDIKKGYSVM